MLLDVKTGHLNRTDPWKITFAYQVSALCLSILRNLRRLINCFLLAFVQKLDPNSLLVSVSPVYGLEFKSRRHCNQRLLFTFLLFFFFFSLNDVLFIYLHPLFIKILLFCPRLNMLIFPQISG